MKKIATLAALAAVGGCTQPTPYTPNYYYTPTPKPPTTRLEPGELVNLTAQQQQRIREGTAKRLKDPESARFGKFGATRAKDGSITVCGYVNGKNSYGGYTGMTPFMGAFLAPPNGSTYEVVKIGSKDTENQAIIEVCGQAGVPLSL